MTDAEKTAHILEVLRDTVRKRNDNAIFFSELKFGGGLTDSNASRRMDFYCLVSVPCKGYFATAYEIKVSRSDFLHDLKQPLKQRPARAFSDAFYYVAPAGLIKPAELPEWAGLIEVEGENTQEVVPAIHRSKCPPSWGFVVAVVRACLSGNSDMTSTMDKATIRTLRHQLKDAQASAEHWKDQAQERIEQ